MALQSGLYPKPAKGFILCDIDGTLANITHRLHFTEKTPKDWKGFFEGIANDSIRAEVADLVIQSEKAGYDIILISARPEDYREPTLDWLKKAFGGHQPYKTLIMRRSGDRRPDTDVKRDMLYTYFPDRSLIYKVIDDRPRVIVETWIPELGRERVIDVGSDDFFKEERSELNHWTPPSGYPWTPPFSHPWIITEGNKP